MDIKKTFGSSNIIYHLHGIQSFAIVKVLTRDVAAPEPTWETRNRGIKMGISLNADVVDA